MGGFRGGFRGKVPKTVDHVEGGIDFPFDAKVGHVSDDGGRGETMSPETCVAKLDGVRIQIISGDGEPGLGKLDDEASGTTGGFKQR